MDSAAGGAQSPRPGKRLPAVHRDRVDRRVDGCLCWGCDRPRCDALFRDGFASADTVRWSTTVS